VVDVIVNGVSIADVDSGSLVDTGSEIVVIVVGDDGVSLIVVVLVDDGVVSIIVEVIETCVDEDN
jgi:hypothetical protein